MKVLVIYQEDTRVSATIPPPILWDTIEATGNWLAEMKKSGKASEAAFKAADHGGVVVFNASTAAELNDLVEQCPARPFCTVQAIPLIETQEWQPVFQRQKQRGQQMLEKIQRFTQQAR